MAHTNDNYNFATEQDALDYMERVMANKSPADDLYMDGPHKMDTPNGQPTWMVHVERFT